MTLPVGGAVAPDGVRGYPIDMRSKAQSTQWPPPDMRSPSDDFVNVSQFGLGCYERFVAGEGEAWLHAALAAARFLVTAQQPDGSWQNLRPFLHTFPLRAPWRCGMAQGQAASLLVRAYLETDEAQFGETARVALGPLCRDSDRGGTSAPIEGGRWPEEYPTYPPSFVLNGALFAWWGMRDVGVGLGDQEAVAAFEAGVETLAANLHRFDTGGWSLYCLRRFPVAPIASSFYHVLHIHQLQAMQLLSPRPEVETIQRRWSDYLASRRLRSEALARKVLFRLVVPRNRLLGARLPWARF